MTASLIMFIYAVGCVLSYGRLTASYYNTYKDSKFMFNANFAQFEQELYMGILLSWVSFIVSTVFYFVDEEEIFLKFNMEDK